MFAKELKCTVLSLDWISPTVFVLKFRPEKNFDFEAGQFISVFIPTPGQKTKNVKRCYSLASSPERSKQDGYELCIKHVPDGKGSSYLASLTAGDTFRCLAPFGDFQYKQAKPGRMACFIATGTGIAPIRSIIESEKFKNSPPEHTIVIFGARSEEEILFRGELEKTGVEVVYALSQPSNSWLGFKGRVTDVLNSLPQDWAWHGTDFYICGNPQMVRDVNSVLATGHGIPLTSIIKEAFGLESKPQTPPTRQISMVSDLMRTGTSR